MTYPKVCLRRGEETGVRAGKPWIFENQLDWADDVCKDGGIVEVLDSRMRFAACSHVTRVVYRFWTVRPVAIRIPSASYPMAYSRSWI